MKPPILHSCYSSALVCASSDAERRPAHALWMATLSLSTLDCVFEWYIKHSNLCTIVPPHRHIASRWKEHNTAHCWLTPHTDTQTHRHTDTQTHRLTHTHTRTHTHTQTDRQTERQTDRQTLAFALWPTEFHSYLTWNTEKYFPPILICLSVCLSGCLACWLAGYMDGWLIVHSYHFTITLEHCFISEF